LNVFHSVRMFCHDKWMLIKVLTCLLVIAHSGSIWAQTAGGVPLPQVVTFVAPAYPRLANDSRMTGTTVSRIRVGKDGGVIEVNTVSGHPFFTKYVLAALKQWRFAPSQQEYIFDVTCRFEFYSPEKCSREDGQPITPETVVSATLPTDILIRTTEKCITITTSDPVEHRQ
jgi:TonB family protein